MFFPVIPVLVTIFKGKTDFGSKQNFFSKARVAKVQRGQQKGRGRKEQQQQRGRENRKRAANRGNNDQQEGKKAKVAVFIKIKKFLTKDI